MKLKIGILKETKTPPDRRVPLTPSHCAEISKNFPNVELLIQSSDIRAFDDYEYREYGIKVKENIDECDILMGVKEVHIPALLADKSYLFFAHVAKKQPHNRPLLQEIQKKNITLIDYEYLTKKSGERVVAFGRWAGIVGTYNALRAKGLRTERFHLLPAHEFNSRAAMFDDLKRLKLRPVKILITGGGRVAQGAIETLSALNLKKVNHTDFLNRTFDEPVYCQIEPEHYVQRTDGSAFNLKHFFEQPQMYESTFLPYTKVTDIYIPCHFWDYRSPVFFTKDDMKAADFKISIIADISCDVNGPIPSTIRASKISNPFYDYNPHTGLEEEAFSSDKNISVMAVDNLPGELPRDASEDFGRNLIDYVLPALFNNSEGIVERATITKKGKLTELFSYLNKYANGQE